MIEPVSMIADLIKQLPAVAALIWIVVYFLKHIKETEVSRDVINTKKEEVLGKIGDNCHAFQMDIMLRNEKMTEKVVDLVNNAMKELGRTNRSLDRFEDWLDEKENGK